MDTLELKGKVPPSPPVIIDTLSREYHWTLSEIKGLSEVEVKTYMDIINRRRIIEQKEEIKKAKRKR